MTIVLNRALGYRSERQRNYILNGAMQVSQERGTNAATVSAVYAADQWLLSATTSGTWSWAQVASYTPAGSAYRIRYTVTAADAAVAATDLVVIGTFLEGLRVADLKSGTATARIVTIQFGVKAPAGTYCVAIQNNAQNRAYVAEYVISGGEANTDVVKSVTFQLDQAGTWAFDNNIGIRVWFGLMVGSNFTSAANAWGAGNIFGSSAQFNLMGTNGNVFELFDVSLTEGSVAPAFQVPDYGSELAQCQRYWESTYDPGVLPGTATLLGADHLAMNHTANFSTGNSGKGFQYRATKRIIPAITAYSPATGASGVGADFVAAVDKTAVVASIGVNGFRWQLGANAANTTYSVAYHFTINARL